MDGHPGAFANALRELRQPEAGRRWLFVPYDQLSDRMGPLSRQRAGELGIVLVESVAKAERRPYHQQKLALVLANLRHFALEQARRGVAVRHVATEGGYAEALAPLVAELGPLEMMEAAERELREELAPMVALGALRVLPHEGWLTTREQFLAGAGARPPWRMDAFYRHLRRTTGILMDGGKPRGGAFSLDAENRQSWSGEPPAPSSPRFAPDAITREVGALVSSRFAHHPGRLDLEALPATRADTERLWAWAKAECLPSFGPFEDAMSTRSTGLFHTRLSPLLNLHRLLPREVLEEVIALELPLPSQEGFVRQLLGWREFVRHVHRETDGFRRGLGAEGAAFLGQGAPLPSAWWGTSSGLACLDTVVQSVLDEGWSHHITRLMVLANLATLLDLSPRELTDWFWALYIDAYDWVVEPNVLAMGTFAVGPLMTTKPYVAGSAYLDRMGDYCEGCAFTPGKDCPVTPLYWDFLARHETELQGNPRLAMPIRALRKRSPEQRASDHRVFETVRETLAGGRALKPPGRLV